MPPRNWQNGNLPHLLWAASSDGTHSVSVPTRTNRNAGTYKLFPDRLICFFRLSWGATKHNICLSFTHGQFLQGGRLWIFVYLRLDFQEWTLSYSKLSRKKLTSAEMHSLGVKKKTLICFLYYVDVDWFTASSHLKHFWHHSINFLRVVTQNDDGARSLFLFYQTYRRTSWRSSLSVYHLKMICE